MTNLAGVRTSDLVDELTRRIGVHEVLVNPYTPFEVHVNAKEIVFPYCEGPCRILVVGD